MDRGRPVHHNDADRYVTGCKDPGENLNRGFSLEPGSPFATRGPISRPPGGDKTFPVHARGQPPLLPEHGRAYGIPVRALNPLMRVLRARTTLDGMPRQPSCTHCALERGRPPGRAGTPDRLHQPTLFLGNNTYI